MRAFVRSGAAPVAFWSKSTVRLALAGLFTAGYLAAMMLPVSPATAQTPAQPPADAAKDAERRAAEFSRLLRRLADRLATPNACLSAGTL